MSKGDVETLLRTLMQEFFQTETSAVQHCRREALRYGVAPPAAALVAVADHAEEVLKQLPELAKKAHLPVSKFGMATGAFFSEMRDKVVDWLIQSERSYRATLLGIRHGVDLVTSLRAVAQVEGNSALADFCDGWLNKRRPSMQHVQDELTWFAHHPELAVRSGKRGQRQKESEARVN